MKILKDDNLRLEKELKTTKKELKHSQKILKTLIGYYKKKEKSKDASLNNLLEENSLLKVFKFC